MDVEVKFVVDFGNMFVLDIEKDRTNFRFGSTFILGFEIKVSLDFEIKFIYAFEINCISGFETKFILYVAIQFISDADIKFVLGL